MNQVHEAVDLETFKSQRSLKVILLFFDWLSENGRLQKGSDIIVLLFLELLVLSAATHDTLQPEF